MQQTADKVLDKCVIGKVFLHAIRGNDRQRRRCCLNRLVAAEREIEIEQPSRRASGVEFVDETSTNAKVDLERTWIAARNSRRDVLYVNWPPELMW